MVGKWHSFAMMFNCFKGNSFDKVTVLLRFIGTLLSAEISQAYTNVFDGYSHF